VVRIPVARKKKARRRHNLRRRALDEVEVEVITATASKRSAEPGSIATGLPCRFVPER